MIKKITFFVLLFFLYFGFYQKSTCHSQPAEKFIILNLHWYNNTIRLNSRHTAEGVFKKKRAASGRNSFLYRVLSGNKAVLDEGYFEVPRTLHFDFPADGNEEMSGGRIDRHEADFVIKIPAFKNSSKVLFFQLKGSQEAKALFSTSSVNETAEEMIGQVDLQ
jgi:hypothetical protein